MKAVQWSQHILLVSNDAEVKAKIRSAFGPETVLTITEEPSESISFLETNTINVLIIDAKTTNVKLHYTEDKEIITFLEIAQYANQLNQKIPTIILVNALLSKDGTFAAKSGATLIMDRKDININTLVFVIRVLRKRTYRTVLSRDLEIGNTFSVDVYHYLPSNDKYLPFLIAGTPFTQEKRERLKASNTRHLYVRESMLPEFLQTIKDKNKFVFTEELATIHFKFRQLLVDFFNISTDGAIHFGKSMTDQTTEIISRLERLISEYPDMYTCLEELPFPRWSALAHGINSAIYALIFSKVCELQNPKEIAFAALIHNIGLADVEQNMLLKSELDLTASEFEEYKKHVEKSINMIQKKRMIITPLVEKIIKEHHENYDGSGYPNSLAGTFLSLEPALISILGSFDYVHSIFPGEKTKNIYEAWELVKVHHVSSTKLKKKFHPTLLEKLDKFFKVKKD